MKRTAVLIATHARLPITTVTVSLLQKQSVGCKIVLVVSDQSEFDYYTNRFPGIYVVKHENKPLGKKWQAGVDFIRKSLDVSAIIIQGSDDILGADFIEKVEESLKDGVDFVGLQRWWIFDPIKKELHLFDYLPNEFPLGGGRYYSRRLLDKINWQIFDTSRNTCLDDLGWNKAKAERNWELVRYTHGYSDILAVKGDWKVLNPLDQTMSHKNAKLIETLRGKDMTNALKELFNYG